MIYLIKAIYISFLLPPGIFIMAFILIGIFLRKKQKVLFVVSICCGLLLYIFSSDVFGDILMQRLEYKYTPPKDFSGDVLVLLGGGGVDKSPNVGFEGHVGPDASNRILTIYSLYNKLNCPIILSGGRLYDLNDTEANIGSKILNNFGVPREKLIQEDQSQNTTQNALFTSKILKEKGFKNPILVTSAYHMPRAVMEFERNNVKVIPYPAGYRTTHEVKFNILTLSPASSNLDKTALAMKEYLGILKLKIER